MSSCRCASDETSTNQRITRRGELLRIVELSFAAARNLTEGRLVPGPNFNVICGDNGHGKTNLIEAVYILATLRSFRTNRLLDVIAKGAPHARLAARIVRDGLERRYEVTIEPTRRIVTLDGKNPKPIARYFGAFNVVLFAPEDLSVTRGAPADRRRFLDRAVFAHQPSYLGTAQTFEKVLKSRNAVLREVSDGNRAALELLPVYDQQLIPLAIAVVDARRNYLEQMKPRFESSFASITRTGLSVSVEYVTSPELIARDEGAVSLALARCRPRDVARGASSFGPHRDDVAFTIAGEPVSNYASQGQLRALILAWKIAEMDLLCDVHGDPPVMLLDDVSSELDETRNLYLFDYLSQRRSQTFITTTHPRHVKLTSDRIDYRVTNGTISLMDSKE